MEDPGQQRLRETLVLVRTRIGQIQERGDSVGEQDTKASLIEPILAALDWKLDDLDEVRREYRGQSRDNPADYALLVFGSPQLFIEAKALGVSLDRKCAGQAIGYASTAGVSWCLLTNGDEYRLYNAHAAVDVDEKLFRSVKLSDPSQEAACLETLGLLAKDRMHGETPIDTLWKIQFVDRRVRSALDGIMRSDSPGLAKLIRKETPELTLADIRSSLRRARLRVDYPTAPITPTREKPGAQPMGATESAETKTTPRTGGRVTLRQLIDAGILTPPLSLEALYKKVTLSASVHDDGTILYEGTSFLTPSAAGAAARATVLGDPDGPYPATDGWTFWRFRDPESGQRLPLGDLRRQLTNEEG